MFSKRRASTGVHMPKHHNQPAQTSAAAATAATTAFKQNADAGLSSAAAAAALRSHPSPTPRLAELQTKRLQRRLSNGSDVSRASAMTTGHIENVNSPSRMSMSDRTLRRSPSPAGRRPMESPQYIPPIPAIPAQMMQSNAGRQRAASLESSAHATTPPQPRQNRRPESVIVGDSKLDRLKNSTLAQSPPSPVSAERARENTRQQVNFSRPMSPQNSPRGRTTASDSPQQGHTWFAGPVVNNSRVRHHVESVRDVVPTQQPVSKAPPLMATDRQSHKFKKLLASTTGSVKQQKDTSWKPTVVGADALESSRWSSAPTPARAPAIGPTRATQQETQPASQRAPAPATVAVEQQQIDQPLTNTSVQTGTAAAAQNEGFSADHRIAPIIGEGRPARTPEHVDIPVESISTQKPDAVGKSPIVATAVGESRLVQSDTEEGSSSLTQRRHSLSPRRAPQLDVLTGEALHHPLGRSASPVKSAMKVRQPGLSRTVSNPTGSSTRYGDDGLQSSPKGKKSVRINLEVKPGEDAGGLGGSKYAPPTPVKVKSTFEDDMTGYMQPRPALPFFGSVRGQRREHEPDSGDERGAHRDAARNSDSSFESPRHSLLAGKGARREDVDSSRLKATGPKRASFVEDESRSNDRGQEPRQEEMSGAMAVNETSSSKVVPATTEPTAAAVTAQAHSLPASNVKPEVDSDDELESSDDDSVYEDASEELENYEFASLDQILEETTPESVDMPNDYMDKPVKGPMLRQESGDTLALERRLEEARVNSIGRAQELQPNPPPEVVAQNKIDENKRKNTGLTSAGTVSKNKNKSKTEMPKTLRSSKWSPVNSSQPQLQSTLRDPAKRSSHASPTPQPAAIRASKAVADFSPTQPMLTRKDSSDSVSSFKRIRKNPRTQEGRYTLRSSMRSASVDRYEAAQQRGRSERRPTSPLDGSPQYKMRSSMRSASSDTANSKGESKWKRLTSPARLTSKLRPNKSKDDKGHKPPLSGRRFSGSFAGSVADSEDDALRRNFVSRFADSDDEDVQLPKDVERPITPVRGIPKTLRHDDDSTDLEDSDDETLPPVAPQAQPPVPTPQEVEQAHAPVKSIETTSPKPTTAAIDGLASSRFASSRPTHKRWSSFLGVGTKKHQLTQQSNSSTPTLTNTPIAQDSPSRTKGKLRRKPRHASQPVEDTVQWPLKDESPKTNGNSVTLPFFKRKDSDRPSLMHKGSDRPSLMHKGSDRPSLVQRGSDRPSLKHKDSNRPTVPVRHPDHQARPTSVLEDKEFGGPDSESTIVAMSNEPRTNGNDSPLVTILAPLTPEKQEKESKSRFGKFKRMMKMSKKQPGTEGVF